MVGGHVGVAKGISNVYRRIESRCKGESTKWSTNFRFSALRVPEFSRYFHSVKDSHVLTVSIIYRVERKVCPWLP